MWADHNFQRSTMSTSDNSLYWACFHGSKHRILQLANQNNVNYVYPPVGDTPLHQACKQGWLDIVEMFIEKYGCDPNVVTKRDNINQLEPLDYAINNNQCSITKYICEHCISSDKMLSPNRIKTTINLLRYIADPWAHSNENPILWKTADGDNILQLVGSSKICIACIPSAVVSEILNSHNANHIIPYFKPDLRTADDDTILEVVCQSRRVISQISSAVMIKWSSESTYLMKIVTIDGITADGNNFLELVCQSEKYLSRISSIVFLNHLRKMVLHSMTIAIPDCKTADGDTLLQLILRSEMSISRISSQMLATLLSNSKKISINEMKNVNPNWKTVDGDHFPHVLCLSNIENDKVTELMQYYILENSWNPDTFNSERNTVLHIACQTDKLVLVSYLIDQAQCNPNIENGMGNLPLDMTTSLEVINYLFEHDRISVRLKTIIEWLNNPLSIYDKTMLRILQSLVDNHKTVSITRSGSTLLHVVCTCSRSRDTKILVEYLLTECQCDPNFFDSKGQMPLQLTSDLRIMKILIEHGAKVTMDVVFKVIGIRIPQSGVVELLSLSLRKGTMLWHPTDLNGDDKTALDLAYSLNKPVIVNYLLTEARHNPNADNVLISLLELTTNLNVAKLLIEHGAKVTPALVLRFEVMEDTQNKHSLIKLMLTTWNPDDGDSDGYTALHLACKAGNSDFVELLFSVAHCDPNIKNKNEELPIQLTTDLKIMKILVEHGAQMTADVVFNLISKHNTDSRVSDLFELLTRKGTIIMYPNDLNNITNDGYTALHLACKADNITIVNFLLSVAHCDPNVNSKNEKVPIQLTSDLGIIKRLVEHGGQMKTDVIFKLILMHRSDFRLPKLLKLAITKGWNPDDLNSNGYTALHLACKANSFNIVEFLLSVAHCDPNVKSKNEELPIQLTSDFRSMKELVEHGAQMTTDVVFKLISMRSYNFRVPELLKLSITKGTMLWNPNDLNSDGYTALHLACKDNILLVDFLLSLPHCDPNIRSKNINKEVPIQLTSDLRIMKKLVEHGAQMTTDIVFKLISIHGRDFRVPKLLKLSVTKGSMLWNPNDLNSDGYTALHLACKANRFNIVDFLLCLAHCDPDIKSKDEEVPIILTSDFMIMKILIEHGAQMTTEFVFRLISIHSRDSRVPELFKLSITKGTMLWNPKDMNSDGYTALHLACRADSFTIVDFLLSVAHCDPNIKSKNKQVPFQLTSDLRIMKILIEHGAQMTMNVVFKLISKQHHTDSRVSELFRLSTRKGTMLRNPNDLNSDGYTALHLACKADSFIIVNYLLSVAHCDPNIKSRNEEVPLQITTNPEIIKDLIRHGAKTSIMYNSYKKALGTNKPLQPPVKVFVVGNPSVGKSTLTAALKTEKWFITQFFSSGKVSGVDEKTVGIVPHDLESGYFGRVTLYDFAGHREFYSGHAALLQTAIQSTPPVFLLVVNLSEDDNEIIKNILYWISFLENQCASVTCRPHIILVGSHADTLEGINPQDKIITIISTLDTKCFTNMEYIGFIAMNCQFHESTGMSDLRHLLITSCQELRIREPITFNAHCFLVYLIDKFRNLTAVTIKTISETIKNQQSKEGVLEFLPTDFDALYKICLELNDRSHILLLKDRMAIENSLIIINKEFLLSKVPGAVFAPKGFKQYNELSSNTGIVPLSKITSWLSEVDKVRKKDVDILIGFLTHLEFCHEISDQALHQLISEQYSQVAGEHYYLFPGLISLKTNDSVWQMQSTMYDYYFGWILKCIHREQFFSSRFLQVLLLRLAFSFALEASCDIASQSIDPGIHRNCHLWKNGIYWGSVFGMQTLVEVTSDNKSVIILARFRKANLLQCVHLRSAVISTILQCKEQFCPRVTVTESFIDSSLPLQYPLNPADTINHTCSLQNLTTAVVRADCRHPDVVFPSQRTIPAEIILSFEPYLEMNLPTIQDLCDEKDENKVIENIFFANLVQNATDELNYLINIVSGNSTNSTSENQLYQDLLRWRDSDKTNKKTYKQLRQTVDQYSVFAGRNVLELAGKQLKLPKAATVEEEEEEKQLQKLPKAVTVEEEEEEKQQCKLKPHGNTPKLHELQLLKLPNGTKLRIMKEVAPEWDEVAVALGFDGARIKTLKMGAHYQPRKACLEMFTEWLDGGHDLQPPTWDVLIQSLTAANLTELADILSRTIKIEAEDNNDSDSSFVLVDIDSQEKSSIADSDMKTKAKLSSKCDQKEFHKVDQNMGSEPAGVPHNEQGSSTTLNIKALEELEGRGGRKVRVVESIGSEWEEVAKALDMGQEDIDMIKSRHSDDDEEACREMLATWLEGNNGEVSWTALTQALIDAGLPQLADSLKDIL